MATAATSHIPAWTISYGGVAATGNLAKLAEHIYYSEAVGGKANILEILLANVATPGGGTSFGPFWQSPPTPGTAIGLAIGYQGNSGLTSCGLFEVDEWEFLGPPDKLLLRAIQAGTTAAIRTPKSYAWESQSLTTIATVIASRYGMTAVTAAVNPDVTYDRMTQRLESDLAFLHRIANEHDYEFTIRGNQLVFYSRPQLESNTPPSNAQLLYKTDGVRYRIRRQQLGNRSFGTCVVTYFDPLSKKLLSALAQDPNANSSDTLKIVERIENQQQATLRAQAHLHSANMQQIKMEVMMPGTMLYRAGNTVAFDQASWGPFFQGAIFFVQEAKHRLDRSGYTTTLELRSTLSGAANQIVSDEFGG